jgi:hypothetical protein
VTDEELIAYVDGELAGEAARRIETTMTADVVLRTRIETLRQQREQLRASFEAVMDAPVPERLRSAALTGAASWRFRLREYLGSAGDGPSFARMAAVAAAALIVGVVAGRMSGDLGVTEAPGDALVARGALATSLETRLAGDPAPGPRMGVSFKNKKGANCRTFATAGMAGIACKANDGWRIAALSTSEAPGTGDFQAAGSAMPPLIRSTVEQMIDGPPFDAAAERRARDRGWK